LRHARNREHIAADLSRFGVECQDRLPPGHSPDLPLSGVKENMLEAHDLAEREHF
jgi:hypothetical protein